MEDVNSPQIRPTVAPAYNIERFYPMNHRSRGKAVIFTHSIFDVRHVQLSPRAGSEVDCKMLAESLERLGFDVILHKDKRLDDIRDITKKVSLMDHSNSDCLLIAILSHGADGELIYARDCSYSISSIWAQFSDDCCRTLVGKPKIFVIQACRGDQLDSGVKIEKDGVAKYSISLHEDFLLAFATIPGFVSFRNPRTGSWFIRELCNELNENGQKYDILKLLTFVVQKVAYEYESWAPNDPELHMKKQIPIIVSKLTRLLFFNPLSVPWCQYDPRQFSQS